MNKLKGKFRAWKSGKHWMYAGVMVIIATGMCTAKVTLADTSALEKQETYRDGYLEGQKDKAKKDAREAALQDEEDRELDDKLIDQQISGYGLGVFTAICKLVKTVVTFFFSWF